jgi:hypothetical protein
VSDIPLDERRDFTHLAAALADVTRHLLVFYTPHHRFAILCADSKACVLHSNQDSFTPRHLRCHSYSLHAIFTHCCERNQVIQRTADSKTNPSRRRTLSHQGPLRECRVVGLHGRRHKRRRIRVPKKICCTCMSFRGVVWIVIVLACLVVLAKKPGIDRFEPMKLTLLVGYLAKQYAENPPSPYAFKPARYSITIRNDQHAFNNIVRILDRYKLNQLGERPMDIRSPDFAYLVASYLWYLKNYGQAYIQMHPKPVSKPEREKRRRILDGASYVTGANAMPHWYECKTEDPVCRRI